MSTTALTLLVVFLVLVIAGVVARGFGAMRAQRDIEVAYRWPRVPTDPGLPQMRDRRPAAAMIRLERIRQLHELRWTPQHDDEHADGALLQAAIAYSFTALHGNGNTLPDPLWPDGWTWKPSDDPVRNLVKAGALIAAEIDRLQRARAVTA